MSIRQKLTKSLYPATKPTLLKILAELNRMEWLSRDKLLAIQRQHIQQLLDYVYVNVPYYRNLFREAGFHPQDYARDPANFQKIPLLTKQTIRQNRALMLTTEVARLKTLSEKVTGGTTGEPTIFLQDKMYRDYNNALDYYMASWSGWQLGQPQFWILARMPVHTGLDGKLYQTKNWLTRRFESDAFLMTDDSINRFVTQMEANPGGFMQCYVSVGYKIAQFLDTRRHNVKLRAVYVTSEPLFDYQRKFMERAFGCPIFEWYGSNETGDVACECSEHNGLHIATRNSLVEILKDGQPVLDGEEGELVLTCLTNFAMPLIRYRIEDLGTKSTRDCPCGRGLPLLEVVEGRKVDLFKTRAGNTVYGMFANGVVTELGAVKQFQVIQKTLDLVIFRIICDTPLSEENLKKVEAFTKDALGDNVTVQFEFVDELPKTISGKHRHLISEVE
jgi:phenylacetate-CoA ligase